MSARDLIQVLSHAVFAAVTIFVFLRLAQRRTRYDADVAVFFGFIGTLVLLVSATSTLGIPLTGGLRTFAGLLAFGLAYALLRLAADLVGVARPALRAAEIGLATAAAILLLVPQPRPAWATVATVSAFFFVALYASIVFFRASRYGVGPTRRRMEAISVGSALLGLTIVLGGPRQEIPDPASVPQLLAQVASIGTAVAYLIGFAPPDLVRRAWREPLMRAFIDRTASLTQMSDPFGIARAIERGAAEALGASGATVALWDPLSHALRYAGPDGQPVTLEPGIGLTGAVLRAQAPLASLGGSGEPALDPSAATAGVRAALAAPITSPRQTLGVLVVHSERTPVFAEDDLELVALLARQAAISLENASLLDQVREANTTLGRSQARLEEAQSVAHIGSWEWDVATGAIAWSDELCRIYGVTQQTAPRGYEAYLAHIHEDDRALAHEAVSGAFGDRRSFSFQHRIRLPDGGVRTLEGRGEVVLDAAGAVTGMLGTSQDITDRVGIEAELVRQRAVQDALLRAQDDMGVAMLVLSGGRITYMNEPFVRLSGHSRAELEAMSHVADLILPEDREAARDQLRAGSTMPFEIRVRRANGKVIHIEIASVRVAAASGDLILIARDVSERHRTQEALRHLAMFDALTDLPNRALFADRLVHGVSAARRSGGPFALLLLDLDGFKEVNDTIGHHGGDELLRQVAARLRDCVRGEDTVARLGGDEFALALSTDRAGAEAMAAKIASAIELPFHLDRQFVDVRVSIGIAMFPTHGANADVLMRHADVAMYAAKRSGSGHAVYRPNLDAESSRRSVLGRDLRLALEHGGLRVWYQPKIDLRTKAVRGVEALARWDHPSLGAIHPEEFVPLAQSSGTIGALTRRILRVALADCCAWLDAGTELPVAVNVPITLIQDDAEVTAIIAILRESGLPPPLLELEITEATAIAEGGGPYRPLLDRLTAAGIRLSIDDYGIGYSSLSYLRGIPLSALKIDRSLVRGVAREREDEILVRSTIELGHLLGLRVVAEGVEEPDVLERLRSLGCDEAQGFLLGRPMPAADLGEWLGREVERLAEAV